MIGIEERINSGIRVARVHYLADEQKRGGEWQAQARQGLSERDWRREYEIDWTIAAGLGVYSELFAREFHVAKDELCAYSHKPILRGWDFGLNPACVWGQVDPSGRLLILAEMVTWDGRGEQRQQGIDRLCPQVIAYGNQEFPGMEYRDWADPAGWAKAQTDEKTCVQIMGKHGIHPAKGQVTFTARRTAMNNILQKSTMGHSAILLDSRCKMLIEGFQGAYQYRQLGETGRYTEDVEKNAWSHPMDALSYLAGGIFTVGGRREEVFPRAGKPDKVTGY